MPLWAPICRVAERGIECFGFSILHSEDLHVAKWKWQMDPRELCWLKCPGGSHFKLQETHMSPPELWWESQGCILAVVAPVVILSPFPRLRGLWELELTMLALLPEQMIAEEEPVFRYWLPASLLLSLSSYSNKVAECGQLRSWEQGGVRREGRCVSRVRRMSGCSLGNLRCATCLGSPERVGREFPDRAVQKGVCSLRTKSRDSVGTVSTAGRPPVRPGKVDAFGGLVANVYSLKMKQIPAGMLALGDWLGHYSVTTGVDIFAYYGVRKPTGGIGGLLAPITKGLSQLQRSPWFWALLQWPWCKASHPVTLGRTPQGLLREARVKVTVDKRVQGSQWWPCFQKPVSEEMQLLHLLTGAHRHGSHTHLNKRSGSIRWRWRSLGNFSTENQPGTLGWQRVP